MSEKKNDTVSAVSGTALTNIEEWKSEKRVIDIIAFTPSLLRVSTFYYPGWNAEVDGQAFIAAEKKSGAMLIEVPAGKHTIRLSFVDTPLRYYAKLISLISCLLIVFLAFYQVLRRVKE